MSDQPLTFYMRVNKIDKKIIDLKKEAASLGKGEKNTNLALFVQNMQKGEGGEDASCGEAIDFADVGGEFDDKELAAEATMKNKPDYGDIPSTWTLPLKASLDNQIRNTLRHEIDQQTIEESVKDQILKKVTE